MNGSIGEMDESGMELCIPGLAELCPLRQLMTLVDWPFQDGHGQHPRNARILFGRRQASLRRLTRRRRLPSVGNTSGGSLDVPHPKSRIDIASYPDAEGLVCSSFVRWLKSAESRYWISGRPGTGKSVLMKFIIFHKETTDSLRKWQPKAQILTHFFWKFGSPMQSSFKGFLCSLVYQAFSLDIEHAMGCLQQNPDWSRRTTPGDWDSEDLQSLIATYLSLPSRPFCLFIDGLDELLDDHGVGLLIDFIDSLQKSSPLLKVCMTSRPEHVIRTRLCRDADLKMQDLTRSDIEQYSRATLGKEAALATSSIDVERFASLISFKAEGVFLWAVLVTRSIARGIVNGDSEADTWKRLQKTPRKLHELYLDMWTRLGEDSDLYRCSTALIFKIVLFVWRSLPKRTYHLPLPTSTHAISILELMLASSGALWSTPVDHFYKLDATDLEQQCDELFTRLPFRTAGLFEVLQTSEHERLGELQWADKSNFPIVRYDTLKVEAIHRTVFDFLIETEDGNKLWNTIRLLKENYSSERSDHAFFEISYGPKFTSIRTEDASQ